MEDYFISSSFRERMQKLRLIARTKVITNLELFAFVLLFLLLSLSLFPMGNIETIILTGEDYNPELSALYIKGILRIDNDPRLRFELAKRYVEMNRFKDAEVEISRLKYPPSDVKRMIPLLRINILERQLFLTGNKTAVRKTIRKNILTYTNKTNDEEILLEFYRKSLSMNMPDLALIIADRLRRISEHKLFWAKECLKQALATSNYKKTLECLNFLILHDRKNKDIYLHKAFNITIGMKDYTSAVRYAEQTLKSDPEDKKAFEFLEFYYSSKGQYLKVIKLCLLRLANAKNYNEKMNYFKTAVNMAMWHGNYKMTKVLIRKYGDMFLNDRKMVEFMLKVAMATGDSRFSEEVADKVFLNM